MVVMVTVTHRGGGGGAGLQSRGVHVEMLKSSQQVGWPCIDVPMWFRRHVIVGSMGARRVK